MLLQDFPTRFSALISCRRLLVTCLICSCPDKTISASWIWPRFVPALCLFPRLPAGPLRTLCGHAQTGVLSFTLSCASPPTLSKWTNWAVPCRWRLLVFGRHARHYKMSLCYLKFKLRWIRDSDVTFGSIFNLSSDMTAGLPPFLRLWLLLRSVALTGTKIFSMEHS